MKNKWILLLSSLIAANSLFGYVEDEEDVFTIKNLFEPQDEVSTNELKQVDELHTKSDKKLKTQVISNAFALREKEGFVIQKGMDQYIVEAPIRDKKELDEFLEKLSPLHTDKAKKIGQKPIVFKYQEFFDPKETPIKETDEFFIEAFLVAQFCNSPSQFGEFHNALSKFGKLIVFKQIWANDKEEIEKTYDLSNCKIIEYHGTVRDFDDYLQLPNVENLKANASIYLKTISNEELKKQLRAYVFDARVQTISIGYSFGKPYKKGMISVPIEYLLCEKFFAIPLVNPQNAARDLFFYTNTVSYMENLSCDTLFCGSIEKVDTSVSCKNIILQFGDIGSSRWIYKINNLENIWLGMFLDDFEFIKGVRVVADEQLIHLGKVLADKNISLRFFNREMVDDLFDKYQKYMKTENITHLAGYVNLKNKPEELSNKEWIQVLVLKRKIRGIVNAAKNAEIK